MARKKILKPTTVPRYKYKIARQFSVAGFTPERVEELASTVASEWNKWFGIYHFYYNEMLKEFGNRIPQGQRGLYRSGLFKMIKTYLSGDDVEAVITSYAAKTGLDEGLLREIAAYFGLIQASAEKQAARA